MQDQDPASQITRRWLSLTDYASKYRVSVSTLRRRIKNGQIEYRFEDGKYLLLDTQPSQLEQNSVGGSQPELADLAHVYPNRYVAFESSPLKTQIEQEFPQSLEQDRREQQQNQQEEPILSSASRLLTELKRAYMSILHEKEEQIIQLKEEVSDLKTLVRVLEDDNDRMRRYLNQSPPG